MTTKTAIITTLVALVVASVSAQNLVSNPGFETPSVGSYTSYLPGSTDIFGWTVDTIPSDGVQLFAPGVVVNNGSQTLQLTDLYNVGGGIHQTIPTQAGTQYTVSIDVASRDSKATAYGYFDFGGQVHQLSATSATFTTLSWQVTATSGSTLIDIYGTNNAGTYQLVIDNVSVTPPGGPVSATNSTVSLSSSWIPADGATSASVIVALKDNGGNPVAGKTVSLSSSRGAADSIAPASGVSSAAGTVTFTVTSTSPGLAVLSATDVTDSLPLTANASLDVVSTDAHGPQAAPDPIVFDQTATNDNLVVLMAAASEYSTNLTLPYSGPSYYPKHFWLSNWNNGTNDYMKWNVALATGAVYHVYAKLNAGANVPLQLSVAGTNTVLNCTTRNIGWDKLDCGTIFIPAGTNQLVLRRNTTNTTDTIPIISLELIRESDLAAYQQRVASFRSDTTWLSQSKYGLMTQFGAWGYPPSGPQPSLNDFANGFDVPKFVNLVTNTGAKYVIFSLTWYTYQMLAPIQAVDDIVPGDTNLTSTRDVIGELAAALHRVGVRFMLYYHTGHDSQWGYDSTPWWQAQQFPEPDHTDRGVGDRSVFFTNWINVITEIGNRYGTNLDGWFFDDGQVYYPAPFERLGRAAKAGNSNRLVSYNPWIAVGYTDFEDVWFGEGDTGGSQFGSSSVGGNGLFTDGPHAGELQQGMFTMEQDWGVHEQNQPITTQISASQAISWVRSASRRGVPLSFNMMLWSDQTYSTNSLNVLLAVKNYFSSIRGVPTNNLLINGDFELPALPDSSYSSYAAGSTNIVGWTVSSTPADGVQLFSQGLVLDDGSQTLQLTAAYAAGGGISQSIATTPGKTYIISIDVASRTGSAVTGNLGFGTTNFLLNASSTTFTPLTWQASATETNTMIDVTGYTNSAAGQLIIDNVIVTENQDPFTQWQLNYFGCTNCPEAQANADPLGKGMSNYEQFLAGLNPTNPTSVLAIRSAVRQGEDIDITWQTAGPRTNILQVAPSIGNALNFSDLPESLTVIPGNGDAVTNYVDPGVLTNDATRFYRVRVVL